MSRVTRAAIIGTGNIANIHMSAVDKLRDRVRVVAAVDVDEARVEAFRAQHSIPSSYTDTGELLSKEKPELVLICTPPGTHLDLSVMALNAGAWVLCEKPLCASLEELDRLAEAEEHSSGYCSTIFQWRFGSGAQHLKRLIHSEEMGSPLVGICQTTWYRDHEYYEVPWRGKWETELGGPTMGHGIHAMDMFLWLMGEWREVQATMGTLDRNIDVEDISMAMVRFENGAMGSMVNSVLSPREESYVRLDLQKATVELRHLYGYSNADWRYTAAPGASDEDSLTRWSTIPDEVPSSHASQLDATLSSMAKGQRPPVSGPEARTTLEFIASLYKSAITGGPVRKGTIVEGDPFYRRMHGSLYETAETI